MSKPYRKKLIEVALPLGRVLGSEERATMSPAAIRIIGGINDAASREKSIRHGHPSTLHLWWARRPLAAARAVIFSQMVDDPGDDEERQRLFRIIEDLVQWENTTNEDVLNRARDEIWKSWRATCADNADHPRAAELFNPDKLPAFHDPFAGGGALPLEAQRLGLESYASDLNPVAVLINKAMIEIPPMFAGRPPVNPAARSEPSLVVREWRGARGLAEDVRYYGRWMRDEAEKRIGHLYPKVEVTAAMARERPDLKRYVGKELTVIAWLWARTVKSPNPVFAHVDVPLASTFMLSTKAGKEVYVEPVIEGGGYRFTVKVGKPKDAEAAKNGTKLARGANFRCLMSNTPMSHDYVRGEFQAKRNGERLMAIVAEGECGRVYLSPAPEQEVLARSAQPAWRPEQEMNQDTSNLVSGRGYGITHWYEIFTPRQLVALTTFSDLVQEARERVKRDALAAGLPDDAKPLATGGTGATAYADAVGVYLGLTASKQTIFLVTQARWRAGEGKSAPGFGRQALPMVWDFADLNPFAGAGGDFLGVVEGVEKTLRNSPPPARGHANQADAATQKFSTDRIVSTDPPYYDNIGYADLSDYFYIWLRHALKPVFPDLFATLAVPKAEELVATPYRHGSKAKAEAFFLDGMTQAMHRLAEQAHPAFPVTIYYAFKQSESDDEEGTASTGWDTFLDAVIRAGFAVTGTWPMRTENQTRLVGMVTNALASSIVLACRKRDSSATTVSRREFIRELNAALPDALDEMTRGGVNSPVAPVDLSQAIIGPGMAIFSKYAAVLEADGKPMTVRTALQLINRFFAEEDFDGDTQFCLHWLDAHGWSQGKFGEAETLSRAKGTSIDGMARAGIVESGRGSVRLLRFAEYSVGSASSPWTDWSPEDDPTDFASLNTRTPVWETLHHLIRALQGSGEAAAGALLAQMPARTESIRQLAYRLYTLCERKGWAEDARAYNELITSWQSIESAPQPTGREEEQKELKF